METKPLSTSWMWKTEDDEIWGLTLDADAQKLDWYDGIGCACGDSFAEQTFDDFLQKGPRYGTLPPDVENEVRAALAAHLHN